MEKNNAEVTGEKCESAPTRVPAVYESEILHHYFSNQLFPMNFGKVIFLYFYFSRERIAINVTVFLLISAPGAYKIIISCCHFSSLKSAHSNTSDHTFR